jgi:hypothetical protein
MMRSSVLRAALGVFIIISLAASCQTATAQGEDEVASPGDMQDEALEIGWIHNCFWMISSSIA